MNNFCQELSSVMKKKILVCFLSIDSNRYVGSHRLTIKLCLESNMKL